MATRSLSLLLGLQFYCTVAVYGEIFSSIARLQSLYASSSSILQQLDDYIGKEEERLQVLRSIREEVSALQDIAPDTGLTVPEHPIGAYHMIKALSHLNQTISTATVSTNVFQSYLQALSQPLPSESDFRGAISAILRLQAIYRLPTHDLMEGMVRGNTAKRLNPSDAVAIAKIARKSTNYRHLTVEWLKEAYEAYVTRREQSGLDLKVHLLNITKEYIQYSDWMNAWLYVNKAKETYPHDDEVMLVYRDIEGTIKHATTVGLSLHSFHGAPGYSEDGWWKNYSSLCRGDQDAITSNWKSSFCSLTPTSIPFSPVKTEVLSTRPFIAIFHDVLSNSEAIKFKSEAFNMLLRANVGDPGKGFVSEARVGQLTWLYDTNPNVHKISQRVMDITGLDVTIRNNLSSSEPFQVVNYGIGGQYEPHFDVYADRSALLDLPSFLKGSGERLATFLFYLNDVTEGGATVFPTAGVRVPAIKNSAAFWYNLWRSGENDPMTLHAGCPVLLGQKWVANKWIREHGQEFRHSCGSHPDSVHHEFPEHRWVMNRA
ncbi:prolyl 4-hydroxylase subunit alpha-1-like [Liolophura sinensis]|uniref:prolyl 4-hydroxylase subunit alpha-1-like n=1 Tax=Liolophura sinensis TaxID=3198878 RepID=UPI003159060E